MAGPSTAVTSFAVTPPPAHAWMLLVAMGGILPLALIGGLLLAGDSVSTSGVWPALALIPLMLGLMLLAMTRRSVQLRAGVLDVRAAMYRKRVAVADLDLASARVVDLAEHTELRPLFKTNGISLPGYHAGHWRLRERLGKAFCLLTDRRRVLWLPARDGATQLLLSLERPQALLDALRTVRG